MSKLRLKRFLNQMSMPFGEGMYTNLDEDRKGGSGFGLQCSLYYGTSGHSPNVHVQSSVTQAPPNNDEPTS